jgi:hypothetical protein
MTARSGPARFAPCFETRIDGAFDMTGALPGLPGSRHSDSIWTGGAYEMNNADLA